MQTINNVIIHKLVKEKHGQSSIVPRTAALTVTEPVAKLVHDIHHLYTSKSTKGYGRFEEDETNYPTARILRDWFVGQSQSFADASQELLTVLANRADSAPLSTGGYVLMAHVTNASDENWFIVAIINNVSGSAIDDRTLEIVDTVHVDLQNLRVAGRITLSDWLGGDAEKRYVGFLKQRGDVADYFKRFLGCNDLVASSEETKKLVKVLTNFAREKGLEGAEEDSFLQAAYDFCLERNKNDEPLSLETLSNVLWPNDPTELQRAFTAENVQISDGFVPDGRSLKSLTKLKYKTPYWTIDLYRSAINMGYARYNKETEELILSHLPEELKAELAHETDDGA